jgi:hypothetical protein
MHVIIKITCIMSLLTPPPLGFIILLSPLLSPHFTLMSFFHFFFFGLFIHLFICAYIVWAICPLAPYPLPLPAYLPRFQALFFRSKFCKGGNM